jgi:hypothetical protein
MSELESTQGRELVRRLSRAAAVLDASLHGMPERGYQVRQVDYQQRQRKLAPQAKRELAALREQLEALPLK